MGFRCCRLTNSAAKSLWSQADPAWLPAIWSDRSPYVVVPESPAIGCLVPHHARARRPGRWRWLRRCPRRRESPGPVAHRTSLARSTLPVVAVIPVPVVDAAPARVPLTTGTPVIARRGRCLRDTAGQSDSGQRHRATHQCARRPSDPRSRAPCRRHLLRLLHRPSRRGRNPRLQRSTTDQLAAVGEG
jgi:hypothetical protein